MNRAAILAVLLVMGAGSVALAEEPAADRVPPPPQTPGQLNSMAAKHPAKPEQMKPLSSAAQATPGKKPARQSAAGPKPEQKQADSSQKAQER